MSKAIKPGACFAYQRDSAELLQFLNSFVVDKAAFAACTDAYRLLSSLSDLKVRLSDLYAGIDSASRTCSNQ